MNNKKTGKLRRILVTTAAVMGLAIVALSSLAATYCLLPIWGGDAPDMPKHLQDR